MAYEHILTDTRGRVGVIKLNRPEKLNAWTSLMHDELTDQLERWNADDGIGASVITGEGRAFCSFELVTHSLTVGVAQAGKNHSFTQNPLNLSVLKICENWNL